MRFGILHPGSMGVSIAAAAKNSGHQVYWASEGRSEQSRRRADEQGLIDGGSLEDLCRDCTVIVCVCPPHAALDVASQVAACGYTGLYVDANAIAPDKAQEVGRMVEGAGASFVDGGIIGGPAWEPGKTWLHLSGERAAEVAACFVEGPLTTNVLGTEPGQASALKMCFAAYTKGSTALVCAVVAAAEGLGVRAALFEQWSKGTGKMDEKAVGQVQGVTSKAWRFEGEMHEIAATFEAAGVPGGFHRAAAEVYRRLAGFKEAGDGVGFEEVVRALGAGGQIGDG